MTSDTPNLRRCLLAPIPEIAVAAKYLDDAANAHISGRPDIAADLITRSDMPVIREWVEALWGHSHRLANVAKSISVPERVKLRMPSAAERRSLHERDGYHCRFCGIPVICAEVRRYLHIFYPEALPWGRTNKSQHPAFQAMWAQYDHVIPYSKGGHSGLDNIVVTCAPCNYGRMDCPLEEVGLSDPTQREPIRSSWDGLERVLTRR